MAIHIIDEANRCLKDVYKRQDGNWYYFSKIDGVAKGGWLNEDGRKRYFDPKTLIMVTGTTVSYTHLLQAPVK